MKILWQSLGIIILANTAQPTTAWSAQIECKITDAKKHANVKSECAIIEATHLQQPLTTPAETLKREAQICHLSRRAQLRATLYELLNLVPLDLINIIITYDSYLLTGTLQCTLNWPSQQATAAIVSLSRSKNANIFYARAADGSKFWCNAATGVISSATPMSPKKKGMRTPASVLFEKPKLIRSKAMIHQSITLPDGSVVSTNGNEITVFSPKIDNQSVVLCIFRPGVITKLLALSDGRLVTGMSNGQLKLWV